MFIIKKQYLSAKCETKGLFFKIVVFPKVVAKIFVRQEQIRKAARKN
jgi:hypothetical protein